MTPLRYWFRPFEWKAFPIKGIISPSFFYLNLLLVLTGMPSEKKRKQKKSNKKEKKIITRSINISSNLTLYNYQERQKRNNEMKQGMNLMRNQQTITNSKAFPLFTRVKWSLFDEDLNLYVHLNELHASPSQATTTTATDYIIYIIS